MTETLTFWAVKWSRDWLTTMPWSVSGRRVGYVSRTDALDGGRFTLFALGPIAIVRLRGITLKGRGQ